MSGHKASNSRFKAIELGRPWCEAIELRDGRRLILRPIQPCDANTLRRSFQTLTPHDVRMRFMHPLKEITPEFARQLTEVDPSQALALVLVEAKPPEEALIAAVARTAVDDDGEEAEFAIIIGPEVREQGLGRHLMEKLIEWSRRRGLQTLYGFILNENRPMLGLADSLGFQIGPCDDDLGVVLARLHLQ